MHKCPSCEQKKDHEKQVCETTPKKWYKNKLYLVVLGLLVIYIVHLILEKFGIFVLHDVLYAFYDYVQMIWFPIIVGLLLGGLIDYFIPREYITRYLTQHNKKTILYSVGLGFTMSACSHGILAIAMELYKKGASVPAIISFLMASPWANLPVTLMLIGLFGWKGLLFIISAIVIAIITGIIYQFLEEVGVLECKCETHNQKHSLMQDVYLKIKSARFDGGNIKRALKGVLKGSWELANMVLWWIIIGMFLASLARAYVPSEFFVNYMGASLLGLVVTLIIATILEVCSEGTAPLAFEIYKQTGAFGNAFVFLMAGVVTDYTEIGLIWANIGKKPALLLPIITVPQVILLGYLFNVLL